MLCVGRARDICSPERLFLELDRHCGWLSYAIGVQRCIELFIRAENVEGGELRVRAQRSW